jgi:hypothetical protein
MRLIDYALYNNKSNKFMKILHNEEGTNSGDDDQSGDRQTDIIESFRLI